MGWPLVRCAILRSSYSSPLACDLDGNARDIVARPGIQGELPQPVGAFLHVGLLFHEVQNLLVGDGTGQTVAAKQKTIGRLKGNHLDLRSVLDLLAAEVLPQVVAEAMLLGLG